MVPSSFWGVIILAQGGPCATRVVPGPKKRRGGPKTRCGGPKKRHEDPRKDSGGPKKRRLQMEPHTGDSRKDVLAKKRRYGASTRGAQEKML